MLQRVNDISQFSSPSKLQVDKRETYSKVGIVEQTVTPPKSILKNGFQQKAQQSKFPGMFARQSNTRPFEVDNNQSVTYPQTLQSLQHSQTYKQSKKDEKKRGYSLGLSQGSSSQSAESSGDSVKSQLTSRSAQPKDKNRAFSPRKKPPILSPNQEDSDYENESKLKKAIQEAKQADRNEFQKKNKLFKNLKKRKSSSTKMGIQSLWKDQSPTFSIPTESHISRQLSNQTSQIVVLLIFLTMIGLSVLDFENYFESNLSHYQALDIISGLHLKFGGTSPIYNQAVELYLQKHVDISTPIISLKGPGIPTYENNEVLDSIRESEVMSYETGENNEFQILYSARTQSQVSAILSMGRTIFICIILVIGSLVFNFDAQRLVLTPIERMIEKVDILVNDPLALEKNDPSKEGIITKATKFTEKQRESNKQSKCSKYFLGDSTEQKQYETQQIENAITKISTLLALGFGEAGKSFIQRSIQHEGGGVALIQELGETGGALKERALFAFANIRHFEKATEVLKENILVFTNLIAQIVHTQVDKYGGCSNKNLGDIFLLVWKKSLFQPDKMNEIIKKEQSSREIMADMAIFSILKIISKINSYAALKTYQRDPKLNSQIRDFKVSVGFGLHYGWAIEGAIGSQFKVDLSYLSPNVNLSSRLCAATKQYGVDILMSQSVQQMLSPQIKKMTREIDTVTVKGSKVPLNLYTIDVKTDLSQKEDKLSVFTFQKRKELINIEKNMIAKWLLNGIEKSYNLILTDTDIIEMREFSDKRWYQKFIKAYRRAYKQYLLGEWRQAQQSLKKCLFDNPFDGPATSLLHYIESHNLVPPNRWKGCHELTQK